MLSIETAILNQHGNWQMKISASRSQTPNNTAARKRTPATRSALERADWHRVDQQLDEELKDTFPASDALSVTRNPSRRWSDWTPDQMAAARTGVHLPRRTTNLEKQLAAALGWTQNAFL
jgi:hypothetical protein